MYFLLKDTLNYDYSLNVYGFYAKKQHKLGQFE